MPGLVAAILVLLLAVLQAYLGHGAAAQSPSFASSTADRILQMMMSADVGWTVLALFLSLVSVKLAMRLASGTVWGSA
ncbi:MAG TPA: hypothetical protein VJW20_24440 [Candidatus Angelobacter sp.]|nr:hypothetical protein [Candidatus Angelobacter sp.]